MGRAGTESITSQVAVSIAVLAFVPFLVSIGVLSALAPSGSATVVERALALLALALGALSICVLVAVPVARRIVKPLTAMTSTLAKASAVVASTRFDLERDDPREIVALKGALNALHRRVDDDARWRTLFTAMVAHDLKAPIVGSLRLLEHLESSDLPSSDRRAWMTTLVSEHRRMLEIVRDLVLMAKADADAVGARAREHVDLRDLVGPLLEAARSAGAVAIELSGSGAVSVDRVAAGRAIANLVENARRHARSRVEVTLFPGLVRIGDDGPGLPAGFEDLAVPFAGHAVLADSAAATGAERRGEAGLGIFIARRLVEGQGGRLAIESSGPEGTVILAYLPTS